MCRKVSNYNSIDDIAQNMMVKNILENLTPKTIRDLKTCRKDLDKIMDDIKNANDEIDDYVKRIIE